ncbi:MAG: transcriptional regulator [Sphingobacteriales bacterium 17-39-43]|uniref:DegT/DnrJ/EryC1/StrS family aminotransferase n=1 Tax=Daejeonella sp. TaxID=2805397 RepID=UPI000BC74395|nr:DegT/DnrJ/EryC1/StrS family aminotransferase [Daejeonella sp.]OYZ30178.1 MAG: transcriptional regulator [Sphingobacteriales bacterium 16-39-50]OZA22921.1 MAG: transcriptional regulator [Sphingobacteriales bacterium 17-39-43]HQT24187.1 DegT/DnrJ/EryC1/StrS family aminotransferase [Daejeonella sp.]HQT58797.1 DegT/DnrJ/EryC1/StrS family aminotransferase [Daejeonella sp.]
MENKIQMVDLQGQYRKIKDKIDEAIVSVIHEGVFINGNEVKEFALELANYNSVKNVITCANGTDALQIAMMALDFKHGDEIIVPAFTYVATVEVISLLGLTPVFIDVLPGTFELDATQLKSKITSRTVCIVPVHLYGQCSNMEEILKVAKENNLRVIEDVAQALGSEYTFRSGLKQKAGTIGDIGTTSFFPSKNLGCYGDGGAIMTNDSELAQKIRMIANHGQKEKYIHEVVGVNSRLDTIQAAILRIKLSYLNEYNKARNSVAERYDKAFEGLTDILIPERATFSTHVFHQYTVKVKSGSRDELKKFLQSKNIPSMIYYPLPLHLQKAYRGYGYPEGSFPVSERLCEQVLSLPIHSEMKEDQQAFIIDNIFNFFNV